MGATFNRVNSVRVDTFRNIVDTGLFLHPQFQSGGSFSAAVVPIIGPTATYGQCWRGMPIGIIGNMLVPISASGATYAGVLVDDITSYTLARGGKVTFAKSARVRSYAGGALTAGALVKVDTSANFSGFKAWVQGTDDDLLIAGKAYPLDDSGGTTSMAQGDVIFVDLFGQVS